MNISACYVRELKDRRVLIISCCSVLQLECQHHFVFKQIFLVIERISMRFRYDCDLLLDLAAVFFQIILCSYGHMCCIDISIMKSLTFFWYQMAGDWTW